MKIKVKERSYDEVAALSPRKHQKPKKPNLFFRSLLRVASIPDLMAVRFRFRKHGMERLGKREPCLFLMNHSCFLDLKIAVRMLYPRPFQIVCTSDGFVGKHWLMRQIGCIPTQKFVFDVGLVRDLRYAVKHQKSSILMYPEASYSFDGRATDLPESVGSFVKLLGVPLVMIRTEGAFLRDPLYNNLQKRKVRVTADMTYLLSAQEIKEKSAEDINAILRQQFDFDAFAQQQERKVLVREKFRADGLNRVLYRCSECEQEGCMVGKGTRLICEACGKEYELTERGELRAIEGVTHFLSVPEWYEWERRCVAREIRHGQYSLDTAVEIYMMVDTRCIYHVGEGRLTHTKEGFHLTGYDGKLDYVQKPKASYSLYADFNWYEIGDMICIGTVNTLYYCFPKDKKDVVAKTRLATEELYRRMKK